MIYPAIGGAFGGREDMSVQIVLALAVQKLQRPVKIIWSREESIIGHHKRHPMTIRARWGATRDGKLVAAEAEIYADAGAYAYTSTKVLGNAHLMVTGPYEIPNVKVDTYAVYTNNMPSGAFRGFGGPQAAFAAENQMNKLAEALGMDPVELRAKNVLTDGSTYCRSERRCRRVSRWPRCWPKARRKAVTGSRLTGIGSAIAGPTARQPGQTARHRHGDGLQEYRLQFWRAGTKLGHGRTARRYRDRARRRAPGRARMWGRARIPCLSRWPPKRSACRSKKSS